MSGDEAYKRFLDGDQSAFEEIVKEYRYSLTCFVAGIVHDFAAAEDIAADAFARLLIKKGAFGFRSSLKTYLFAIAKNRATDWLRKQKHTAEPTEDLADKTLLEDQLFRDEKRKAVNTCLARLKDDYRQVLYLLFFEEMSYEQAAQVLKKSKKQIDNLAFRGKQALKKELEKEGIGCA